VSGSTLTFPAKLFGVPALLLVVFLPRGEAAGSGHSTREHRETPPATEPIARDAA
jgi:hypothetical protein